MGGFDGLLQWGKDALKKGVDTVRDVYNTGNEAVTEAVELAPLADDFMAIYEVSEYFEQNQEDLESIGIIDVLANTQETKAKVDKANEQIAKARRAVGAIRQTNIKFSGDFLGPTVEHLQGVVARFEGAASKAFQQVIKVTAHWYPENEAHLNMTLPEAVVKAARNIPPAAEKMNEMRELSLSLQGSKSSVRGLSNELQTLIDPNLEDYSTNMWLNGAIAVNNTADKVESEYERWKDLAELAQAAKNGNYTEVMKRGGSLVLDDIKKKF